MIKHLGFGEGRKMLVLTPRMEVVGSLTFGRKCQRNLSCFHWYKLLGILSGERFLA